MGLKKLFKLLFLLLFLNYIEIYVYSIDISNIKGNNDLLIWGIINLDSKKVLIIRDKNKKDSSAYFLIYQDRNLVNYKKIEKTNIYSMKRFYFTKKYFVIYTLDNFLLYNEQNNSFFTIEEKHGFVGNLIIYKNYLYYSTEKTKECIRRIDLNTREVTKYISSFANTPFFIIDDKLFIRDYFTKDAYLICGNSIINKNFKIDDGQQNKYTYEDIKTEEIIKYSELLNIGIY